MKTKSYILAAALVLGLAGCSLDQEPGGSTITKKQYDNMDDKVAGSVNGVYSLLYAYGGEHDAFGLRSIDMYGDLLCGDMAMKTQRYGWFNSDELGQTYQRRSYFWSFYYNIIRQCNLALNVVEADGKPTISFDAATITDEQYAKGYYYAELLTLRGWAYSSLLRFFTAANDVDINTELSIPIYTEADTKDDSTLGAPRSTMTSVFMRVEEDLLQAIAYFTAYNKLSRGENKLHVNIDVARMVLAYSYLNKGVLESSDATNKEKDFTNAIRYVDDLLGATTAQILPQAEVLTNGFNNVDTKSWIWGEAVTVENTTGLASFFGQCDIYSYSYASAGDIKGIDEVLFDEVKALGWDIREGWWNNFATKNPKATTFQYAPDGKFFSAKSTTLSGDRDWLSDNVFMRIELAYLIGAEAAYRNNDYTKAITYLTTLTDQRVKSTTEAQTAYDTFKAGLTDADALKTAIRYNWRVELWGEGYGLQTFKRWNESVKLGNSRLRTNKTLTPSATPRLFTFELPTSETRYNPFINNTTELTKKQ